MGPEKLLQGKREREEVQIQEQCTCPMEFFNIDICHPQAQSYPQVMPLYLHVHSGNKSPTSVEVRLPTGVPHILAQCRHKLCQYG